MSMIGYENWAVDLAEVGAIYPMQGWEVQMTIVGVIFWLGWHRLQFVAESREYEEAGRKAHKSELEKVIERY